MDFISSLLEGAIDVAQGFGNVLVESVQAITNIFWTPGVSGGAGQLTIVGAGLSMALGVGAIYLLFRLVRGLVKTNERG